MKVKTLQTRVTEEQFERFSKQADKEMRTVSSLLRVIIEEYLKKAK